MEQLQNDDQQGKHKKLGKNLLQCRFDHHVSGIEPEAARRQRLPQIWRTESAEFVQSYPYTGGQYSVPVTSLKARHTLGRPRDRRKALRAH
jgi:hypothetical protein